MRILFLTEGTTIPASRFRVGQFLPHFRERGIECVVRPGYGDLYNKIAPTPAGSAYKLGTRLLRIAQTMDAGQFDLVFLQRPTLPFTPLPELLVHALNRHTIFDVDDAIFLAPDGTEHRRRQITFETIVDRVQQVICGNSWLAEHADHPAKTTVIPTVIDCGRYTPGPSEYADDYITIGWMGTSSNFGSLRTIVPTLRQVLDDHEEARFRIVSNGPFAEFEGHPQCEQIRWSADAEIELLRSFDIGLMPLVDTLNSRGKCGFKMIQYMAVGTPVVSSPVGANVEIFEGSDAGHLTTTPDEWRRALHTLIADADQRRRCSQSARDHVVENYSIRSVIDDYIELFEEVASS